MDKADAIGLHVYAAYTIYVNPHVKKIKACWDRTAQRDVACYQLCVSAAGYARHVKIFRSTGLSFGWKKETAGNNENKTGRHPPLTKCFSRARAHIREINLSWRARSRERRIISVSDGRPAAQSMVTAFNWPSSPLRRVLQNTARQHDGERIISIRIAVINSAVLFPPWVSIATPRSYVSIIARACSRLRGDSVLRCRGNLPDNSEKCTSQKIVEYFPAYLILYN